MSRTLGALVIFGFVALPLCTVLQAQAVRQTPGASVPGPAAPRPQTATPPRDGGPPAVPTGTGRIRGRVVSADTGSPLRRAQVRMSGNRPGLAPVVAYTDADGRYEFLNLPAAAYSLMVSRTGYVSLEFGQQRA